MDKYTVVNSVGEVDVTASLAAYEAALTKWVKDHEIPTDSIATAVSAVLDRFPGKRVATSLLSGLAFAELGLDPELHNSVVDRIETYIKGQVKAGTFTSKKGSGGGVQRAS